jgi:hypothetical protein
MAGAFLAVDWDLEAPGLHRYFRPFLLDEELTSSEGLIDLVDAYATRAIAPAKDGSKPPADWYLEYADYSPFKLSLNFGHFPPGGKIDLLPSGRQTDAYGLRVSSLNWQNLYDRLGGGGFFEALKARMRSEYDYVLIDSRTGVSDTTGICSVQMPDTLVVCFTLNNQSIRGSAAITRSALKQHGKLVRAILETPRIRGEQAGNWSTIADSPGPLRVFPVPMRVDPGESDRLAIRQAFARKAFAEFVSHLGSELQSYWGAVEVPHQVYYSYEEVLATLKDDPVDPKTVLAAFVRLARFITDGDVVDYRPSITPEERQKYLEAFAKTARSISPRQGVAADAPETEEEALVRMAERALAELGEGGKAIAFRVLSRLVRLGRSDEGGGFLAIRVPIADFSDEERRVISLLAQKGLLTVTSETRPISERAQTRSGQTILLGTQREQNRVQQTVALTDERLPKLWPWLDNALMADAEFLLWRQQMRIYLADWERSGRERQALLTGRLFSEAEHWMLRRTDDLNAAEAEYILESESSTPRAMPRVTPAAGSRTRIGAIAAASVLVLVMLAAGYKLIIAPRRDQDRTRAEYAKRIAAAVQIADPAQRAAALNALASAAPAFVADLHISAPRADAAVELPSLILRAGVRRSEDLQFDPSGERVGCAFSDGAVWVWRLQDGAPTVLDARDSVALSITFDSNRVSAGYANGRIRLWDTQSGRKLLFVGDTKSGPVHQISLEKLDAQDWLLTSSEDGTIGLWSLGKLDSRLFFPLARKARGKGPLAPWDDVRLLPADRKLVAASSVHGFEIWDPEQSVAIGRPPNEKLASLFPPRSRTKSKALRQSQSAQVAIHWRSPLKSMGRS